MLKTALAATAILMLTAGAAAARPGDTNNPIALKMALGTDVVTVHGVLRQNVDCCVYTFKAGAGQTLHWTLSGPAARIGLTYPNGDGINPGLPNPTPLPQTGAYTFSVSPDLMAEGAFGKFTLTIRIP
ncbi:MAG TPA: hypothetical protein VHW60_00580, partial [Caulobacteraceae bacterium]|nr:hypothetical protein [Caulobacteraceae bacterium]